MDIYLLGSYSNPQNQVFKYTAIYLNNQNIIIDTTVALYKTKLTKQLEICFLNAQIYDNDEIKLYPAYYGTGTEWVKI